MIKLTDAFGKAVTLAHGDLIAFDKSNACVIVTRDGQPLKFGGKPHHLIWELPDNPRTLENFVGLIAGLSGLHYRRYNGGPTTCAFQFSSQ